MVSQKIGFFLYLLGHRELLTHTFPYVFILKKKKYLPSGQTLIDVGNNY